MKPNNHQKEELLDVIDDNNDLTGETVSRKKAHAEGIWHRTVHIYLYRKNRGKIEFLVHLRSQFKDLSPNKWDTRFGGHIQAGVALGKAVQDELEEEIGLNVTDHDLIEGEWYKRDNFPNCEYSKVYFLEYLGKDQDLKFNDGEVQAVKWMSIEGIKKAIRENEDKWSASLDGFEKISSYLVNKI